MTLLFKEKTRLNYILEIERNKEEEEGEEEGSVVSLEPLVLAVTVSKH